ncbi:MAG: YqaA family protein [Sandaracinaceae bacterium]
MATPLDGPGDAAVPWYRWPIHQLRRLYHWTLAWAETPYALPALGVLSFIEASFFPIPPDILLLPMALARPRRAWLYAGVCTAASVLGAVLGWVIGVYLWRSLGVPEGCPEFGGGAVLFRIIPSFSCDSFAWVQAGYQQNAFQTVFISAFTPIPFKVFTIAAGVFHIGIPTLVVASAIGRGARFFLVAGLVAFFGPSVREFIEKRFEILTVGLAVVALGILAAMELLL